MRNGIIFAILSVITMVSGYIVIDSPNIFWGVFLMIAARNLEKSATKFIKESQNVSKCCRCKK